MDYKQAGVNIEEGYKAVAKYRDLAAGTANPAVINGIGSFAGMFSLKDLIRAGAGMEEPVLVSGTDGVGTKLELAFQLKKYDTVGIDCVAMCVNDLLCHGGRPLFFLDYIACGKLDAEVAADLVKGVAIGCRETGSVLLGGETAEMPGFYEAGKYDMAGFAVGIVDRKHIIDGSKIQEGDVLVGIASSGPHSNGFSLIRRVLPDLHEDFGGMPLGMALLEPTRLYVKPVLALLEQLEVRGMAHITGGGFYENVPRMFCRPLDAVFGLPPTKIGRAGQTSSAGEAWTIPPIFARIAAGVKGGAGFGQEAQEAGAELLETDEALRELMFNTYNMGIGFVLALAPKDSGRAIDFLDSRGYPAWEIGTVRAAQGNTGAVTFV
ncbi:MAG: phosphoribosylformylglycinamidine cyclo-ligase [Spirochaetaceae bacterium]|jgi:phosphoribosylformylglycinamidine cyclo-ligase|nr:phosphoribosylformylglycinamidine cyclo-ligase [Spirochaetaceae bacterium]